MAGPPCICHPLHSSCDPKYCAEASPIGVYSGLAHMSFMEPVKFSFSREQLAKAVDGGCSTCEVLQTGIAHDLQHGTWKDNIEVYRGANQLIVKNPRSKFEYFQEARLETECNAFPIGNSGPLSTASEAVFNSCRAWIDKCVKTHPLCGIEDLPELPRRVIDIGYLGQNSFSPYLHESNGERGNYAALSHCWGKKPIITTTTATLESRKKGIPWEKLSRTFQDALVIAEKLGLRYIWIDSLCIIQDDFADWETESKKMATIYEASMLAIAATGALDGEAGCFTEGHESIKATPSRHRSHQSSEVWYRELPEHGGFADYAWSPGELFSLHLFDRAWCLQEELLARRVLYYTEEEVIWQCKTLLDCSCGRIVEELSEDNQRSLKLVYEGAIRDDPKNDNMSHLWSRIVMQYTSRKLTKESDRLPALSGLAKVFQPRGLGNYVAGLWTKDLPLWLTWRLVAARSDLQRGAFIAPSWSWASITSGAQVYFEIFREMAIRGKDNLQIKIRIKDVHCELAGSDITGAIKSGRLNLIGPVVEATCIFQDDNFLVRKDEVETIFQHDYKEEIMKEWEGHAVQCLLICTLGKGAYFIVLVANGDAKTHRRIGMAVRETVQEPGMRSWEDGAVSYSILEKWFDTAEHREVNIV